MLDLVLLGVILALVETSPMLALRSNGAVWEAWSIRLGDRDRVNWEVLKLNMQ